MLKKKIMNTVILPAMTYGTERWLLTIYQKEKLAVAQSMEKLRESRKHMDPSGTRSTSMEAAVEPSASSGMTG